MELNDWLTKISQVHPVAWDLGLERVSTVANRMGILSPAKKTVLVAGTNGKGSTCECLLRLAMRAGL
ncbi:MAG: bifunctional tetrahydrofolate synthase/dihydrofolate synthase, partial [Pseudomonadales bacterium]